MKQVNFTQGMKPTVQDLNDLHNLTEDALFTLLRALAGSTGKVLFDNSGPSVSIDFGTQKLTLSISPRYFAINGAIGLTPLTVNQFDVSEDFQVGIFFILKKSAVEAIRNFLSLDSSQEILIQQDLTEDSARIEYTIRNDLITSIEDPILADDDVGYVKLGDLTFNSATQAYTFAQNTVDTVVLPVSASQPVNVHGSSHVNGPDFIPAASLANVPGGSTLGLVPQGGLTAILGSIQDIVPATSSAFIEVSNSGTNDVDGSFIDQKISTINLKLADSLTSVDDGQQGVMLGVTFRTASTLNGIEDVSARADHAHPLVKSGLVARSYSLAIDATSAYGEVIGPYRVEPAAGEDTGTNTVGRIVAVRVGWRPPNKPDRYLVDTGWCVVNESNRPVETVGCRAIVASRDTFYLELGEAGVAIVTQGLASELAAVWQTGGRYAKSGHIVVDVLALRAGSFSDISASISA
jgi:hypothetical protein